MDWLERGQNLKKVGVFCCISDRSFLYQFDEIIWILYLIKNFGHKLVTLLKVKQKVKHFPNCTFKDAQDSDIFDLINLWNIIPNLLVSASVLFSTGMTFSDPSPRIQHFSLSLNSRTHSCPFKAYNLLLCEMVLMPNIHTLFCKICNLGWW